VEVFVVQIIGERDRPHIPLIPSTGLVTPEQQDRLPSRIKAEQDPQRTALRGSQFLHRLMSQRVDAIDDRSTKIGATFCKHINSIRDGLSLVIGQRRPPLVELIGDLDLPHRPSMTLHSS